MRLTVEGLSKTYRGGVQALRGVNLSLKPGLLRLLGFMWNLTLAAPIWSGRKWLDPMGLLAVMNTLGVEAKKYVPGYRGGMSFQIDVRQHVQVVQEWRFAKSFPEPGENLRMFPSASCRCMARAWRPRLRCR